MCACIFLIRSVCVSCVHSHHSPSSTSSPPCPQPPPSRAVLVLASPRAATTAVTTAHGATGGLCACHCTLIDCCSDPMGWGQPFQPPCSQPVNSSGDSEGIGSAGSSNADPILSSCCNVWDLQSLEQRILSAAKPQATESHAGVQGTSPSIVVLDSLDPFLRHNTPAALLAMIARLQWHASVSGLLLLSHADVTPPAVTSSLRHMAHALLSLEPHPGHSILPLSLLLSSPLLPHPASSSHHPLGNSAVTTATNSTSSTAAGTGIISGRGSGRGESGGSMGGDIMGDRHVLPGGILMLQQKRASGKFRTALEEFHFDRQGAVHIDAQTKGSVRMPQPPTAPSESPVTAPQPTLASDNKRDSTVEPPPNVPPPEQQPAEGPHTGLTGRREGAAVEPSRAMGDRVPEVSFRLELSEEERAAREKVVLPYEHRGETGPIKIYDGRRSLAPSQIKGAAKAYGESLVGVVSARVAELAVGTTGGEWSEGGGGGLIHYERDSDDEYPDSDEDPDDDLDI
ncbi:unnamed protein product [Closterium sp. NIES-54]